MRQTQPRSARNSPASRVRPAARDRNGRRLNKTNTLATEEYLFGDPSHDAAHLNHENDFEVAMATYMYLNADCWRHSYRL